MKKANQNALSVGLLSFKLKLVRIVLDKDIATTAFHDSRAVPKTPIKVIARISNTV